MQLVQLEFAKVGNGRESWRPTVRVVCGAGSLSSVNVVEIDPSKSYQCLEAGLVRSRSLNPLPMLLVLQPLLLQDYGTLWRISAEIRLTQMLDGAGPRTLGCRSTGSISTWVSARRPIDKTLLVPSPTHDIKKVWLGGFCNETRPGSQTTKCHAENMIHPSSASM